MSNTAKILLVDDRPENLLALEAVLEPLGHELITATSGEEALRLLLDGEFAVVLLDVQMPGIDGFETAALVKERDRTRHIPIIFLTAHDNGIENVFRGYQSGAVDYMHKPFHPAVLRSKVVVFVDLFMQRRALHEANEALRRSENRYRTLVDHLPGMVVSVVNRDLRYELVGGGSEHSARWRHNNLIGKRPGDFLPADRAEAMEAQFRAALAGEARSFDWTSGDGDRSFWLQALPVRDDDGKVVAAISVSQDITERKRGQQALELAHAEALAASRAKSMFVANVSHEIRTPMNGVIGMAALLLGTELDPVQREYAETVSSSGEALLAIINDILDFSKMEADKLQLDPTDFDLRDMVEEACGMLAIRAHEKDLELVVAIDPELPQQVRGDAARLRQVVVNFVSNAIKFTAEGEVVVRVSAERQEGDAAVIRVEVEDTGIGIDTSALERLFTPFSQADGSTTRKYGGTGLGLAISRRLIELMHGELGAESEPGKGSKFWFELAFAPAEGSKRPSEPDRNLGGMKVLVIDGNATNRTILERQLSSWEGSCDSAAGASQALELLEAAATAGEPYALALVDQKVDGYELADKINVNPTVRGMRLVLLTPSGGRYESPDGIGMDGFLTKPVRVSRLYEEIQAVMTRDRVKALAESPPAAKKGIDTEDSAAPIILVVEDTPVNQLVAKRLLEMHGFRAEVAGNGREALEALAEESFAAVLMDCQMPELDGYEATKEIRRREHDGHHTPIIAMTANSMQGDRARCLAAGMDDYLSKPLRTQTLEEALRRWVPR